MENLGGILEGLAALAWPILVILLLVKFSGPVKDIIISARRRKFTIKVGDNELTMEEVSEQQRLMINDLQEQVVTLQQRIESTNNFISAEKAVSPEKDRDKTITKILWVDDYPSNNANIIAHLSDLGVDVVTALSTKEGLRKFRSSHFDAIISDMSRREDGKNNSRAGVDLATAIRELDQDIPFFIFCSQRGKERAEIDAMNAGVNGVTTSGVRLLNMLSLTGKVGKL